jgi:hypothetical protein
MRDSDPRQNPNAPAEPARSGTAPGDGSLITGWLRDHGEAPHGFRPRAEPSYFLRVQTTHGERTLWSPGLKRALHAAHTQPQIGDEIGIRGIEVAPIAAAGVKPGTSPPRPRTHWIVERLAFFAARSEAAQALRDPGVHPRDAIRAHPELLASYLILDSAREVAERRYADPDTRAEFLSLVRETFAQAAERGVPLPIARLGTSATEHERRQGQTRRRAPALDRSR